MGFDGGRQGVTLAADRDEPLLGDQCLAVRTAVVSQPSAPCCSVDTEALEVDQQVARKYVLEQIFSAADPLTKSDVTDRGGRVSERTAEAGNAHGTGLDSDPDRVRGRPREDIPR